MTKYAALICLLGMAPVASADLIVDYEGRVTKVDDTCWCRSLGLKLGDPVKGHLLIDTDRAPPDEAPSPTFGLYWGHFKDPGFVAGWNSLIGTPDLHGDDRVIVDDNRVPGVEQFIVGDSNNSYGLELPFTSLLVSVYNPNSVLDLLHGDRLDQSFTVGNGKNGVKVRGELLRMSMGRFRSVVLFVIDRLTVRPQVCHA